MALTPEHAARVLGLDDNATLEDVRQVRRAMAFKNHPDCSSDIDRSTRHMARINAAADTLAAHIKALGKVTTGMKRPKYSDFTAHQKANQRAQYQKATATRSETRRQSPSENPRYKPRAWASDTVVVSAKPLAADQQVNRLSVADRNPICLAAQSYRAVLIQIGVPDAEPTIDTTALAFSATA